jgi:membrane-associated protein
LCFLFVWFDAVIPIFPGETTLSAASTIAAGGNLDLGLVMLVGGLGAIIGDSSLFWIARKSAAKVKPHLDKALENPKVRAGWGALDRSPGLLIMAGRSVPGMRFVVNASIGLSEMPYRRFLPWSALSGALWSVYTCALAYWVSTTLAGYPLAPLVISSLITSALAAVYFVDRHKRRRGDAAKPADAGAQPPIPSSIAGSGK